MTTKCMMLKRIAPRHLNVDGWNWRSTVSYCS